jgi:FtsH-binding integral membrane protein
VTSPGYQSYVPPVAGAPAPGQLPRPATLTFAFYGALLVGLFSIIGGILLIADSRHLAEQTAAGLTDDPSVLGNEIVKAAVDQAASALVVRGVVVIVSGVLVLAIAFAVRNGAMWARIVMTLLVLAAVCSNGLVIRDVAPAATKALDVASMLLGIAVVVLIFLPPSNKYASARKRVG